MAPIGDDGYDKEEEYFHRQNRELLARKRAELDAARERQKVEALKEQHWMRCPKCGHSMEEVERSGIKVDRCTHCGGTFFDAGELELLLESEASSPGMLGGLKKLFGGS